MKKLMIAAAVVLAGIAANATTYNWKWSSNNTIATKAFDSSSDASAGTMYLIWGFSGSDGSKDATASKNALLSALAAVTDGDYESVIKKNANYKTSEDLVSGKLADTEFTETTSGGAKTYAYAIILDKDASGNMWAFATANKNSTGVAAGDIGFGELAFTIDSDNTYAAGSWEKYGSAGWYQVQAGTVPEPTSGLLLLLGVAGLALRRRRA